MYILGIESSCDETAVGILRADPDGRLSPCANRINSQVPVHRLYGGVVPEIASRAHIESISALATDALSEAGISPSEVGLVAVTSHPGLIGALLVGVNFAKAFAFAHDIPLVSVNHMKAHVAAAWVESTEAPAPEAPPFLALVVSGGHTSLYHAATWCDYEEIGATRDDAIGESFDKVGRLLGLPYPAGAAFDRLAAEGFAALCPSDPTIDGYAASPAFRRGDPHLPSPALHDGTADFSFSGLKTASVNFIHHRRQKNEPFSPAEFAAAFTYEAVEAVCRQTELALDRFPGCPLVAAGGVSANSHLRQALRRLCKKRGISLSLPPLSLCGDNGLMVCAQGYREYLAGHLADVSLNASAADSI